MLATEGVTLDFDEAAIDELALLAEEINTAVENIGARRLHTILERLLEEISFTASDRPDGTQVRIDRDYVRDRVGALAQNADLSQIHPVNWSPLERALRARASAPHSVRALDIIPA